MGILDKKESPKNPKVLEIHSVYIAGGQTNPSYCITIPKYFARILKLDKHSNVVIRLIATEEEEESINKYKKMKRPYLIIGKEDHY